VAEGSACAGDVGVGRTPQRGLAPPGLAQEISRLEMTRRKRKWRIEGRDRAESGQ
jgi:hypothetical protein